MGKAEWLGLYFCFVCCLDEESCTGCYWWSGDARACIQVVSFVWVHTIWYSLGLVLWLSRVLELVLPLQTLRDWSLSKDQPRSKLPRGISLEMKGPLLYQEEFHSKWKGLYLNSKSQCTRTQWRSLTQWKLFHALVAADVGPLLLWSVPAFCGSCPAEAIWRHFVHYLDEGVSPSQRSLRQTKGQCRAIPARKPPSI